MFFLREKFFSLAVVVFLLIGFNASAQSLVVPIEDANASGNSNDNAPLGAVNQHFQQDYAGSLLATAGLMPGDQITAIGFRITGQEGYNTGIPAQTVSDYSIWMGLAANSPGNMSSTFADNGLDMTQVRSGELDVTAGQFTGGSGVNPFGMIQLSLPYAYTGGDLLIEISYSGFNSGGYVDIAYPYDSSLAKTAFGSGPASTTADAGLYDEAIIMAFDVSPVPEPSSVALFVSGTLGFFFAARNRSRR